MKWSKAVGAASALAITLCGLSASAQNLERSFPDYMQNKKPMSGSYSSSDRVPLVRGKETFYVPGNAIVLPNSSHTLTNKTIDCSMNNCINFPGIPYSAIPECPDVGGQHLNFPSGAFTCGSSGGSGSGESVTIGGVLATMGGLPITGL